MKNINNINNDLEKMNDIYYLVSKENQYKLKIDNNVNNNNNIRNKDFLKYKKEIKNKINELYNFHNDNSGNKIFNNINNQNEKYLNHFNLFIFHLIKYLKAEKIKSQIQKELISFNTIIDNSNNIDLENLEDLSKNINLKNTYLNNANKIMFNKPKPNSSNVEEFVSIFLIETNSSTLEEFVSIKNIEFKTKIIPKKR